MILPVRVHIDNPRIYGIYDRTEGIYFVSTNPKAKQGCIYNYVKEEDRHV